MIIKIKNKLRNNEGLITKLLEDLGAQYIKQVNSKQDIRWGDGNGSKINIESLYYESFSHNKRGDVIVMVGDFLDLNVGESITWLAEYLSVEKTYTNTKVVLPFCGFWKSYGKVSEIDESNPITYPLARLQDYDSGANKMWINEGISALTQEEFMMGYDSVTNRITIPWISENGELVGIMGRLYTDEIKEHQSKYLPIIAFNKSRSLYGFYQNYENILNKNCIIITESEKSVLKGRDMGYDNVVAIGGNNLSRRHEQLIKSMYCNVVIALDEGIELSHCIEQAQRLKINNPFFSNETYILDMSNMPNKTCVFDLDKTTIDKAFKNRLIYVGE